MNLLAITDNYDNYDYMRTRLKSICAMRQCCEKINSFTVIPSKTAKPSYFFHSRLSTFYSLAQLLLPTVKLNGVNQPISIEYKMVASASNLKFRKLSNLSKKN